jgi:hypothetical protein
VSTVKYMSTSALARGPHTPDSSARWRTGAPWNRILNHIKKVRNKKSAKKSAKKVPPYMYFLRAKFPHQAFTH